MARSIIKKAIGKYLPSIKQWAIALGARAIWRGLRLLIRLCWGIFIQVPSIVRALLLVVHSKGRYLLLVGCHSQTFIGNSLYFASEAHRNSKWLTFWVCNRSQFWPLYRGGFIPVLKRSILEWWLASRADVVAYSGYYRGDLGNFPTRAIKLLLWHGMSLKGVGLQCRPFPDDVGNNDLTIATSPFTANMMSTAFGVPKDRVLVTGEPETDGLFAKSKCPQDIADVPWQSDNKVVLYLPTWREDYNKIINGEYAPNNEFIEKKLRALFNDQNLRRILTETGSVMVTKLHPYSQVNIEDVNPPFYLLPTDSFNTESLMQNADVLISDYSGALVDWLVTGQPAIAYAFDLDDYIAGRGIPNFDYKEVFGEVIVQNRRELATRVLTCLREPKSLQAPMEKLANLFHRHRSFGASERVLISLEKCLRDRRKIESKFRGS